MTTTQTERLMALADRYAFHIPGSQHSDEARDALLAALQEQAREGEAVGKVVPLEPTEEMWAYLARDIVFWLYTCQAPHYGSKLHEFLNNCGTTIPEWLTKEIPNTESTPAKGTVAVCIYKAMIAAAAPQPAQPKGLFVDMIAAQGPEFVAEMAAIGSEPAQPYNAEVTGA